MLCITAAPAVVLAVLVVRARRSRSHVVTERVVQEAVQNRAKEREAVERKPPEIERLAALVDGYWADTMQWDAIMAVGDVYRKGAFPRFLPGRRARVLQGRRALPGRQDHWDGPGAVHRGALRCYSGGRCLAVLGVF